MINRIKDILGIEGVRIKLKLNEQYEASSSLIDGSLILTSQSAQRVENIVIKLIEKYKRGRSESILINDYLLGSIDLDVDFQIEKGETKIVEFELPFNLMKSEMDIIQEESFFSKPFVALAKFIKNVKSEYRIEATAIISGTKFHPIASEKIILK